MEIKPARNQFSTAACAKAAIRSAMGNDGYWPNPEVRWPPGVTAGPDFVADPEPSFGDWISTGRNFDNSGR
jgi:hypothetical protein